MLSPAILQFGTGRLLLAHVDLFISEALAEGRALGRVFVVQSTSDPASAARTAALAGGAAYPVVIRGLERGQPVQRSQMCNAIADAVHADAQWPRVREAAARAQVIVSNTADRGWLLDALDTPALLHEPARAPRSYPAKLLVLLHGRWLHALAAPGAPQVPLSILPCELVERNADTLRDIVCALARAWQLPAPFVRWIAQHCVWANTLVDRIVSEAIEPVGAVAEPHALWAVQRRPGLVMPCEHAAVVLTDDLDHHARLKLYLLNGAHTFLAECWLRDGLAADFTVAQALNDPELRGRLEALWAEEIVPVFAALGQGVAARDYLPGLRERLLNPYLAHRLADIAQHHAQKKQRRLAPLFALAAQHGLALPQRRLRWALAGDMR